MNLPRQARISLAKASSKYVVESRRGDRSRAGAKAGRATNRAVKARSSWVAAQNCRCK
jgi:hypothetical protein